MLLDVRMPGMDGIEAARHLDALDEPPAVIFTTAYDEHALEAFETQAVGYLLKPVRKEKLARALRHAARIAGQQLARVAEQTQLGRRRAQICARLGEQLRLIPLADIYYFAADQKYVTVRHRGGSDLIDESLRALAARVRAGLRAHPSQFAGRARARACGRARRRRALRRALQDCDETLPVSRRHAAAGVAADPRRNRSREPAGSGGDRAAAAVPARARATRRTGGSSCAWAGSR